MAVTVHLSNTTDPSNPVALPTGVHYSVDQQFNLHVQDQQRNEIAVFTAASWAYAVIS